MTYKIYADGGCAPNPGPGGYAFRVEAPDGQVLEGWGYEEQSTNNRMEILAATEGLRRAPHGASVELICDSQYVLNGCSQWRSGWEKRNMCKADGQPVLNADAWLALWAEVDTRTMKYTWVRGHTGNAGNERVDALVGQARAAKETRMPPAVAPQQGARTQAAVAPAPAPVAAPAAPTTAAPAAAPASASGSTASTETMLMSLLSAKFSPMLRADAQPNFKDTAASVVALLKRMNWTAP